MSVTALLAVIGLIPAHAGKTPRNARPAGDFPAHPRSRGKNLIVAVTAGTAAGSSPLTRGKRRVGRHEPRRTRLIPAHAGKTYSRRRLSESPPAHPRSRGENGRQSRDRLPGGGSSPLTRGKPIAALVAIFVARLIPAHAGKTQSAQGKPSSASAHPRSRGENAVPR